MIVTDNLFGDILTDLAGAVTGGIGLAASGNINPDGAFPSMFEPVHGSAPDIAGTAAGRPHGRDPLHRPAARSPRAPERSGEAVTRAVEADIAEPRRRDPPDRQVGDAIVARLRRNLD